MGPAFKKLKLIPKIDLNYLPKLLSQNGMQFKAQKYLNVHKQEKPNFSSRMTNMTVAIYRKLPETRAQLLKPTTP